MIVAWSAVENLIRSRAIHRKGFVAADLPKEEILKHAMLELEELMAQPDDLSELADLFGCLIHYAIVNGWSIIDVQRGIVTKLEQRFTGGTDEAQDH